MKKLHTVILFFFTLTSCFSQTIYTVETLPNPKLISDAQYVCNPDQILSNATETSVNLILRNLEDSTTSQVAVVVVQSIGDKIPKDFATQLFRFWGIGQKENNNGLLIFLVIDQRRMEFETGYGMEGILTDGMCKRIQVEKMVPKAKEGNYDAAVLEGVQEVYHILMNPKYRDEIYASSEMYLSESKPFYRNPVSVIVLIIVAGIYLFITFSGFKNTVKKISKKPAYIKNNFSETYLKTKYGLLNIFFPAAVILHQTLSGNFRFIEVIAFIYLLVTALLFEKRLRFDKYLYKESNEKSAYDSYQLYNSSYKGWGASAIFFPLPFLFLLINNQMRKNKLRNTAPENTCGDMLKLDEKSDDAFLKDFQLKEEELRSVDYDVWKCKNEESFTVLKYPRNHTKYSSCPSCGSQTYFLSSTKTIKPPTYSSTGQGVKTYLCKFCNFKKDTTFSIAKKTTSSSSSGSGGSGGGGGGGGGFGGGSSGGGGAGSGW